MIFVLLRATSAARPISETFMFNSVRLGRVVDRKSVAPDLLFIWVGVAPTVEAFYFSSTVMDAMVIAPPLTTTPASHVATRFPSATAISPAPRCRFPSVALVVSRPCRGY
jgi:hypothetical protein